MDGKTNMIITASIILALAETGCTYSSNITKTAVAQNHIENNIIAKTDVIYNNENWEKVEEKWHSMDKVKVSNFEEIYKVVEEEKKEMDSLLEPMVKENLITAISSQAITLIYGENLRNTLEGQVELPCCYEPIAIQPWDCNGVDTKEELKNKLSLLEEAYEKETIKKDIYDTVKKDINGRLNLLDKADAYWKEKETGKNHMEEIDLILHLYDANIGQIQEGKDVSTELIKASEYIVKLEQ